MAGISIDQVKDIADVVRIEISEEEATKLSNDLNELLEHVELLNELDTENVEPTTHVVNLKNVMRDDEPKEWITQEEALKNAPDAKDGYFRVPSIME